MSDILVELAEAVPVEINLPEKDNAIEMEVYYQDEVSLDTDLSLFYIKSGEKEIESYVENVSKPEINDYIETYAKPIVSEVVDNIATPIIDEYFEETVKPEISRFAAEEMSSYAEVATTQAGIATAAAAEASTTAQTVDAKVAEFSEQTEASKQEFIAFADEKTEEFEQTAQQATADSQANVEHARIWAEGEQAEVKPLGGELSSMGAADLAYALANAPEDTPIDASGLFAMNVVKGEKGDKGDKGDKGTDGKDGIDGKSVFDGYATNCITEIPQDIKLELNNGTLTLKAGSKVYVPNGFEADGVTPKFDYVIIESDLSTNTGWAPSGQNFLFYDSVNKTFSMYAHNYANCSIWSGDSPTIDKQYGMWFNTTNNIIQNTNNTGSSWAGKFSLPLTIYTCDSNKKPASIEQIFNGFGYIGSTVFALPGVKGLIPNGRNADGTLKNIEWSCSSVVTRTFSSSDNYNGTACGFDGSSFSRLGVGVYLFSETENLNKNEDTIWRATHIDDNFVLTGGIVTSFNPKLTFHAVDRNDSSWVAQQAMPSGKYVNLTMGASGSTYTAPANGWVNFVYQGSNGQWIFFYNDTRNYEADDSIYGQGYARMLVPVNKGDSFKLEYSTNGSYKLLRFIYAEGDK